MNVMVIIPTYNEIVSLPNIISAIRALSVDFYITIVDDNSPDGTGKMADDYAVKDSRIHVIHRAGKLGLGSAYREGFAYALSRDIDFICQMDADMSHDPRILLTMIEELKRSDMVIGSRYLRGVRVNNWAFRRLLLSKFANLYVQFIAPLPIEDSTSGFKCFRRKVLESINLPGIRSEGYCFQIETTFRAYKKGFNVVEVPITFYERQGGFSKMSRNIVWEAFWLVIKLRLGWIK